MDCKSCKGLRVIKANMSHGVIQGKPCPECAHCRHCRTVLKGPDGKIQDRTICDDCERWKSLTEGTLPNSMPSKPSPMAVDSRGLHEKYFQDG